jgi:hypothetical protein
MSEITQTQRTLDLLREEWTALYREALEAIANYTRRTPHTDMGEACGIDACIGCLIHATAADALSRTRQTETP